MGKKQTTKNEADVKLRLDILKADLTNKDRELKNINVAKSEVMDKRKLVERQLELREKIHAIAQKNFGVAQPKWTWETIPEYVELNRELSDNEFQFKRYELLSVMKQMDNGLKSFDEQIESQAKAREFVLSQIAELEKGD